MNHEQSAKLAVLIDADNASADIIEALLEEIAKYGIASVKRIYGDWSSGLKKWKNTLLPHAITPVQQFAYTKGKNATDMALVIDAMDLLYSGTFDGFCIVSSDSDFTRLASRLRENGLTVYGFGERKTPESFRKACDKFVYTEIFQPARKTVAKAETGRSDKAKSSGKTTTDVVATAEVGKIDAALLNLLYKAVKESADDLGWAGLGPVGSYVGKVTPDFDARNYGFSKLSSLIKSLEQFETQVDNNQLQIRKRKNSPTTSEQTTAKLAASPTDKAATGQRKRGHPAQAAKTAKTVTTPATVNAASSAPPENTITKNSNTLSFSRLIPLVQQAIDATTDEHGWARLGNVVKQLQSLHGFTPQQYGFDHVRDAIHGIYADWLEIKKAGRGERVRINKRFVVRDERSDTTVTTAEHIPQT